MSAYFISHERSEQPLEETNMEEELLTYAEVRKLTGCKLGTLYSMVKRREIPHVRLGRRLVRFNKAEIQKWLKKHAVPTAKEVA